MDTARVHSRLYGCVLRRVLRFYVPYDTKQVISETFFPANVILVQYYAKTLSGKNVSEINCFVSYGA